MSKAKQDQAAAAMFRVEMQEDLAVVRFEEYSLVLKGNTEADLRVRDLEFARFLGYEDPHKIRDLIRRLIRARLLEGLSATMAESTGGRPGMEYWLTREQALKVAAKSDTPRAAQLLNVIVDVFLAVLDGRLVAPANDNARAIETETLAGLTSAVQSLAATVAKLVDVVQSLDVRLSNVELRLAERSSDRLGRKGAQSVRAEIRSIAMLYVPNRKGKEYRERLSEIETAAKNAAQMAMNVAWEEVLVTNLVNVQIVLRHERRRAEREAKRHGTGNLFAARHLHPVK